MNAFCFETLAEANEAEKKIISFFDQKVISPAGYAIKKCSLHQGKGQFGIDYYNFEQFLGIGESPLSHIWVYDPKQKTIVPNRVNNSMLKCLNLPSGYVRLVVIWKDNVVPEKLFNDFKQFVSVEVGQNFILFHMFFLQFSNKNLSTDESASQINQSF